MKSIHILCFFLGALAFAGCKQKGDTQKSDFPPAPPPNSGNATDTTKSTGGHDYTFLTYKMLIYKASVTMGKDATYQPYAGQWIKFDSDGTFKAGKLDKQTHTGKWTYNHEARVLLIQPDDKAFPASEWKVLFNDDMIVFVGTDTYANNATQIQLVRSDKFPEK